MDSWLHSITTDRAEEILGSLSIDPNKVAEVARKGPPPPSSPSRVGTSHSVLLPAIFSWAGAENERGRQALVVGVAAGFCDPSTIPMAWDAAEIMALQIWRRTHESCRTTWAGNYYLDRNPPLTFWQRYKAGCPDRYHSWTEFGVDDYAFTAVCQQASAAAQTLDNAIRQWAETLYRACSGMDRRYVPIREAVEACR